MALIGMVLAAAVAAAAPAKDEAAGPAAAAAAGAAAKRAKPAKPKLICVEERAMGSLFKQRTCATEAEWTKRRERDADALTRSNSNNGETR